MYLFNVGISQWKCSATNDENRDKHLRSADFFDAATHDHIRDAFHTAQ